MMKMFFFNFTETIDSKIWPAMNGQWNITINHMQKNCHQDPAVPWRILFCSLLWNLNHGKHLKVTFLRISRFNLIDTEFYPSWCPILFDTIPIWRELTTDLEKTNRSYPLPNASSYHLVLMSTSENIRITYLCHYTNPICVINMH